MRAVHLLKRAGKEFVRNLSWMLAAFGPLAAILIFATSITLLGALPLIGIFVCAVALIITVLVLWSGAHDETKHSVGHQPGTSPDRGGDWFGGWGDGGGGGGW